MSTSLLFPYSSSTHRPPTSDQSALNLTPQLISLGSFSYASCHNQAKTPLLKGRRHSPQPAISSHPALENRSSAPIESSGHREIVPSQKKISSPGQIFLPLESLAGNDILPHKRKVSVYSRNFDLRELSPSTSFKSLSRTPPKTFSESSSSISPLSPISPLIVNIPPFSSRISPVSLNSCSIKPRLKKSQSTLIMPSLLTLFRQESAPPSSPLPKEPSSKSLNEYTSPSPLVRKCHTMVSLSANANSGVTTTATAKVTKEKKSKIGIFRRLSSSRSVVLTSSKSSSSLQQASLRKSPSFTHTFQRYRKTSAGMWCHPEHPNEGDFIKGEDKGESQSPEGSVEDGKGFGGGCSRCASTASGFSRRQSTVTNDAVFCKLCLTDVSIRETYQLQQCHCRFCTYCMCMYTTLKIREGEPVIECPDSNCDCKGEIFLEEVESLVGKELLNIHLKFRRDKEIEMDPLKTWCPKPGCETVISLKVSKHEGRAQFCSCPSCSTRFCAACSGSWHPGKTCHRNSKNQGVPFNELIKRCPRCKVPIERDAGCAQMQCKKCKHVFCWYCLKSLEDDFLLRHYDKGPCKNKLGHSRASVLWHRAQVVIIFVGFGILLVIASPLLLFAGPCLLCRSCRPCSGHRSSGSSSDSDQDIHVVI